MGEFFLRYGFWLFVVGIPILGWVIVEIAQNWRKVRISEHLNALKQTMVDRGMSADEIERVLQAGRAVREPAEKIT
jgi:hypothetical protein